MTRRADYDERFEYSDERDDFHKEPKRERHNGKNQSNPLTLKPFDSIAIPDDPTYRVKDILPDIGIGVIFGPEKCGKSFWLFDLLMHVALGWEYRGHDVRQGPVVYLALEGGRGFGKRIVAWRDKHLAEDHDPVPFWLLDVSLKLVRDQHALIAAIRNQVPDNPVVIAIDTLNRTFLGSENDSEDMNKFIEVLDILRDTFNCLVAVIHHCPLIGGRPRGHSSLSGADDVQIAVEKNDDTGIVTIKVIHMKDDEAGLPLASKLKQVEVGRDFKGNPITSCIVEAVDAKTAAKTDRKLGDASQFGLDLLVNLISDKKTGLPTPDELGLPLGTRVTYAETWRTSFIDDYHAVEDRENRARTFRRVYGDLNKKKIIGVKGQFVWLTSDLPDKADN
jgi:hypothetical protein